MGIKSKPKVKVDREVIKRDEAFQESKRLICRAGVIVAPYDTEYLGSATVHFFKKPTENSYLAISTTNVYQMVTQIFLSQVPEGFADAGFKELQKRMMEAYGRSAKD